MHRLHHNSEAKESFRRGSRPIQECIRKRLREALIERSSFYMHSVIGNNYRNPGFWYLDWFFFQLWGSRPVLSAGSSRWRSSKVRVVFDADGKFKFGTNPISRIGFYWEANYFFRHLFKILCWLVSIWFFFITDSCFDTLKCYLSIVSKAISLNCTFANTDI